MKIAYTGHATSTGGGRDQGFSRTDDGHLSVIMATPSELGGSGKGTNPEQMFAIGYSACFLGAMRFAAGKAKIDMPINATTKAHIHMGTRDDGEGFGNRAPDGIVPTGAWRGVYAWSGWSSRRMAPR